MSRIEDELKKEAGRLLPGEETKTELKRRLSEAEKAKRQNVRVSGAPTVRRRENKKQLRPALRGLIAAVVVLCVAAGLTAGLYFGLGSGTDVAVSDSYISIDVNPSFAITADKNDTVLSVAPLNADAEIVLYSDDYAGMKLSDVCESLIADLIDLGYMDASDAEVELLAVNSNQDKENRLADSLSETIKKAARNKGITAGVALKNNSAHGNGKKTNGKQAIINEAVEKLGLTKEQAESMTVGELNKLLKNCDEEAIASLKAQLDQAYAEADLNGLSGDALKAAVKELKRQWKNQFGGGDGGNADNGNGGNGGNGNGNNGNGRN